MNYSLGCYLTTLGKIGLIITIVFLAGTVDITNGTLLLLILFVIFLFLTNIKRFVSFKEHSYKNIKKVLPCRI